MISTEILKADLLDIVFDNRNKQYGAYTLRKYYPGRLVLSLGMALSTVFLLFLFTGQKEDPDGPGKILKEVTLIDPLIPSVKPPEVPKVFKKIPAAHEIASQKKFIDNFRITDNNINQLVPLQEDLGGNASSDADVAGIAGNGLQVPPSTGGTGTGEVVPVEDHLKETVVQREPEFPGGMQAWIKFLNRNLRVPDELEAGEKKSVLIRFLVDVDGRVTGFEVVQSAGSVYDKEVIRVLGKMPRWKPAIQNNQPVARSFTQPVTFMGLEQ